MSTNKVWSPYYWYLLHTLSYTYSEGKKEYYIKLIKLTADILPCPECRSHFKSYFSENPIYFSSLNKDKLIRWFIDYHNDVNRITNKEKLSKTQVYRLYHDKNDKLKIINDNIIPLIKILYKYHTEEDSGDSYSYTKFLKILQRIYPCQMCRRNLQKINVDSTKNCTKEFIFALSKHKY